MNPIFVAIDTPRFSDARDILTKVAPHIGGYKVGLEYFSANGPHGVFDLFAATGLDYFLDLKYHDIPNTVAKAIKAVNDALPGCPPAILTVHASGGAHMMQAARDAADPKTKVVGVTVLTSLNEQDLHKVGVAYETTEQVRNLAHLARLAGLDGIVCSGEEVQWVKGDFWPEGFMVVPGIRLHDGDDDQKRVVTPKTAMERGADVLVIGRPITAAADPAKAAQDILESLDG